MKLLTLFVSLLLFASCAQDLYVQYPSDDKHDQTIKLQPNKPTYRTYVTIDHQLIVDYKNVRSVTIENVPAGMHEIDYVCDNTIMQHPLNGHYEIQVKEGQTYTHLIEMPPNSTAYWIGEIINYILLSGWLLVLIFVL